MTDKSKDGARPPKGKRAVLCLALAGILGLLVQLDRTMLASRIAMRDLEVEPPVIVQLGNSLAELVRANAMIVGVAGALLIVLAGVGALDRLLKPAIAVALLGVLLVGGATASGMHGNHRISVALGEE